MIYAESGINWMFVYEVEYEDEDILVLVDKGRYHKFDDDRMFEGKVDKWIDFSRGSSGTYVNIGGHWKLTEIKL